MSQLSFDEQQVISALERLPLIRRVVFAAASAQRLMPAYVRFAKTGGAKTPTLIPTVLERLWDDLSGLTLSDDELAVNINRA